MRNLINILDLSTEEIDGLVRLASDIIDNPEVYADSCKGKILGALFFEPSTRTRLSFTSAMMSLGGQVLGFDQAGSSSVSKGEKSAMAEVGEEFGFPVYSVVDVYDIIEYLSEDPANEENVTRIKNYLAVYGANA